MEHGEGLCPRIFLPDMEVENVQKLPGDAFRLFKNVIHNGLICHDYSFQSLENDLTVRYLDFLWTDKERGNTEGV